MKKELAERIVEILREFDDRAEIYEDYSGRGMFGRTTTGVVFSNYTALMQALYCLGHDIAEECVDDDTEYYDTLAEIGKFRFDNLGLDYIVY